MVGFLSFLLVPLDICECFGLRPESLHTAVVEVNCAALPYSELNSRSFSSFDVRFFAIISA